MNTKELQIYLSSRFPIENEQWEWKEFTHLKHVISGHEGEDMISYIYAIQINRKRRFDVQYAYN
jgi:hypothetical protein